MKISKEKTYECVWKFVNNKNYVLPSDSKKKDLDETIIQKSHADLCRLNEGYKETEDDFRNSIILCADDGKRNSRRKFEQSVFSTFAIYLPIFITTIGLFIYLFSQDVQCWSTTDTKSTLKTLKFLISTLVVLSLTPLIRRYVFRIKTPLFDKDTVSAFGVIKGIAAAIFLSQVLIQIHYCGGGVGSQSLFLTFSAFIGMITILMIIGFFGYALLYGVGYLVDNLDVWSSQRFIKQKLELLQHKPAYLTNSLTSIVDEELENWFD
jgi:hypothetical protein